MSKPGVGPETRALRLPRPRPGWRRWAARLLPAVLACTFAGAGQAQTYPSLDDAVRGLIRTLVNEASLGGQKVLVKSDDFFEMGTELHLKLSDSLSRMSFSELSGRGVPVSLEGSDEDAVRVLHGRWRRESRDRLYLELFVAAPVRHGEPTALKSAKGWVSVDESIGGLIEPALEDWGRLLVLRLERRVRDRQERRVRFQPVAIGGDGARDGRLGESLANWIREAFASRRESLFRLVVPPPGRTVETDAQLESKADVYPGSVEVSLNVIDNTTYEQVTSARATLDRELFPPGVVGSGGKDDGEATAGGAGRAVPGGTNAGGPPVVSPDPPEVAEAEESKLGLTHGQRVLVQEGLASLGHDVGEADGVIGGPTREALRSWQESKGLEATGYLTKEQSEGLQAFGKEERARARRARVEALVGKVEAATEGGEFGEARKRLEELRELEAAHPRLEELAEGIARAEEERRRREADDAAFARAKGLHTASGYREYLAGGGRHEEEARRLLSEVEKPSLQVGDKFRDCEGCPEMVVVPSGSFRMGSPSSEEGRGDDEGPVHRVTISRPFAVGVYEVTRGEFGRFVSSTGRSMGDACWMFEDGEWKERSGRHWRNPGFGQSDGHPVLCVSWEDAKAYVGWLSSKTGEAYRLLSESEWEYVARAGTETRYWWGNGISPSEANYGQHKGGTVPVGRYSSNAWGLYDVLGNVWEWVEDCWNGSYRGAPSDGRAWTSGDCGMRVLRGGSWFNEPRYLRSANRNGLTTVVRSGGAGFRVARTLTP